MFEERFEMWWNRNEQGKGIPKSIMKEIWMAGKDEGFKVGFDKGRQMGKKEGYTKGANDI